MKQVVLDKALGSPPTDLPKYSQGTFRGWYKKQKTTQARFARQIAYFHGCCVQLQPPAAWQGAGAGAQRHEHRRPVAGAGRSAAACR